MNRRTITTLSLALATLLTILSILATIQPTQRSGGATGEQHTTIQISICIDYGNGTRVWFNNTRILKDFNLLNATMLVAARKKSIARYIEEEYGTCSRRKINRSLKEAYRFRKKVEEAWVRRAATLDDRPQPIVLAVDDLLCRRYGEKASTADYYRSSCHGGVVRGNHIVDVASCDGTTAVPVAFAVHRKERGTKDWGCLLYTSPSPRD